MDLIDRLRTYASTRKGELAELITEAADALERQTCEDAVSRQAAIDALGTPHGILYPIRTVEELPAVQPSVSDCWGCNCPKMERAKEQKTFSEMVHLHDDETHDKRTETHACDSISRQAALRTDCFGDGHDGLRAFHVYEDYKKMRDYIEALPSVQPHPIVRCKDCKFYSPMNRETKTGICNLTMHQNFGDNWFCAGAERRTDEQNN